MLGNNIIRWICILSIIIICSPKNSGQCQPTTGLFYNTVNFLANSVYTSGQYQLTKTSSQIQVQKSGSTVFTHNISTDYIAKYFFYGTNSQFLAIQEYKSTTTTLTFKLFIVNLVNAPNPVEYSIYYGHFSKQNKRSWMYSRVPVTERQYFIIYIKIPGSWVNIRIW